MPATYFDYREPSSLIHYASSDTVLLLEEGLDLFLDVDVLGVELVLFSLPRGGQISIHRLASPDAIGFLGFL